MEEARERKQDGNGDGSGNGAGTGTGVETRGQAGTVTGAGMGTGTGTGSREWRGGGEESFGIRHIREEAEYKTRHCHSARGIISVARRWRLQIARSFWRKNRAPAQRCGTEGRTVYQGREGGNGDGNRDGGGNEDEDGNEHEGRDRSENGNENGDDNRDEVGGEGGPGNLQSGTVLEVGRKMRKGGRRQRVTNNHTRRTRRPRETVASCSGPEHREGGRGKGSGRAEERRRSARNRTRVVDVMWKAVETWAEGEKNINKKVLVQNMSTNKI